MHTRPPPSSLFFFNDTATTEIYTLSLHDALPISHPTSPAASPIHAELVAVLAAVTQGTPRVLTTADGQLLPAGAFEGGHPIGRAHLLNPLTVKTRMAASACKKKKNPMHINARLPH